MAFETAVEYYLEEQSFIKIPTAPCYLATKFEAFKSRGHYDGYSSHDFEDIVFVFQTKSTIWNEMNDTSEDLKQYLKEEFTQLLNHSYLMDWLDGNVDHKLESNATTKIHQNMTKFVNG